MVERGSQIIGAVAWTELSESLSKRYGKLLFGTEPHNSVTNFLHLRHAHGHGANLGHHTRNPIVVGRSVNGIDHITHRGAIAEHYFGGGSIRNILHQWMLEIGLQNSFGGHVSLAPGYDYQGEHNGHEINNAKNDKQTNQEFLHGSSLRQQTRTGKSIASGCQMATLRRTVRSFK